MIYLGDFPVNSTVYIPFNTFSSVGASVTIAGLAVTDIEVYKDGSATQRASDNGYTLLDGDGIDFDGITGIHGFSINLSDNSDAGFYAAGHEYFVVVASITVDGQTVNFVAASFSIDRWYNQAITRGQVKITANAANEGALDIRNANAAGHGTLNDGGSVGLYSSGGTHGQYNAGTTDDGVLNTGGTRGQHNTGGSYGTLNTGGTDGMNCTGTINAGLQLSGNADGLISTGVLGYGEYITGGTAAINPEYMAAYFGVNSTETSATAIEGSVVKEIMDGICTPTVFPAGAIDFTYTVTDSVTTLPIEGVEVWISTDNPAVNIVWKGDTDAFGVARDVHGELPALDAGTYYFWRQKAGYTFSDPDTEVAS
jgi:hypothetical protein